MAKVKCLSGRRHREKPGRCLIGLGAVLGLKRKPESRAHLLLAAGGRRWSLPLLFVFSGF